MNTLAYGRLMQHYPSGQDEDPVFVWWAREWGTVAQVWWWWSQWLGVMVALAAWAPQPFCLLWAWVYVMELMFALWCPLLLVSGWCESCPLRPHLLLWT